MHTLQKAKIIETLPHFCPNTLRSGSVHYISGPQFGLGWEVCCRFVPKSKVCLTLAGELQTQTLWPDIQIFSQFGFVVLNWCLTIYLLISGSVQLSWTRFWAHPLRLSAPHILFMPFDFSGLPSFCYCVDCLPRIDSDGSSEVVSGPYRVRLTSTSTSTAVNSHIMYIQAWSFFQTVASEIRRSVFSFREPGLWWESLSSFSKWKECSNSCRSGTSALMIGSNQEAQVGSVK